MAETPVKLQVGLYSPGDEADILALNLLEYGSTNVMVTPEDFQWRYAENPAGQTQITVVRDAQTGHVVGFTWTIPLRMRLFRQDQLAALTANLLIHPDYRKTMAYVKLITHRMRMLRQQKVPFRYNFPVESLFARTAKIEGMSSFLIPLMIRPLDMTQLARARFEQRWAAFLIGLGGALIKPFVFYDRDQHAKTDGVTLVWVDGFDRRFDDLWKRVKDKYEIMTVRDSAYLRWRFSPVSKRVYRTLAAMVDDVLVGYVVVRCTDEIRGIPIGLIMDFLLEPGPRGERAGAMLLREVWRYFNSEKVALAGGLALPHTVECKLMQRAGYRSCPPRLAPRLFRVAFNCYAGTLPATDHVQLSNWFLTIADYEAH